MAFSQTFFMSPINMDRPIAITTAPIEIKAYFINIYLTKGMMISTDVPPILFDEISIVPLHIISSL